MKIFLVRHGESTSDVKEKYDGDYDDHLTEQGLQEAKTVAEQLIGKGIEIIYTSPKIRAIETSNIISNTLCYPITILDDLAEQDIYSAYLELGENQPEEEYHKLGEVLADHDSTIDGVESYQNLKERVIDGIKHILESDYTTVAVITHGGPIRCIFREILKSGELKSIGNGAIIELDINNSIISVTKMTNVKSGNHALMIKGSNDTLEVSNRET